MSLFGSDICKLVLMSVPAMSIMLFYASLMPACTRTATALLRVFAIVHIVLTIFLNILSFSDVLVAAILLRTFIICCDWAFSTVRSKMSFILQYNRILDNVYGIAILSAFEPHLFLTLKLFSFNLALLSGHSRRIFPPILVMTLLESAVWQSFYNDVINKYALHWTSAFTLV